MGTSKITVLITSLVFLILISGCSSKCPDACDDNNPCTSDSCSEETNFQCTNSPVNGKQPGCSADIACGSKTCKDGVCEVEYEIDCCGNEKCEMGETYDSCADDCPDCGVDNACKTNTRFDYHNQECVSDIIIPCCGNDICDEDDETFENCLKDCPDCDDNDKLTTDIFNYESQECESKLTHILFDDFESGTGNWRYHPNREWSTIKEGGNTVFRGLAGQMADLKGMELGNYTLKLRIKVISDGIGIYLKIFGTPPKQGRYNIFVTNNTISLERAPALPEPMSVEYSFGEDWHDIEARVYDDTINILVDNEMLIKYKVTDIPFPPGVGGTFSLSVSDDKADSEVRIDDVEIMIINEGDVTYP